MNRYTGRTLLLELSMIAVTAAFLFPLYVVLMVAVKTPRDLATNPLSVPHTIELTNFTVAWSAGSMGRALIGSTLVVVISIVLQVFLGAPAAYVLARRQQRVSYGLYLLFLLGLILPPQLGLIPLYQTMRDLGLLGSYVALILTYAGGLLPFTVFLYTGFIRTLPADYEYAAWTDGASPLQAFVQVVFPLIRPITGTVLIMNAIFVWNDFLTPLLYIGGSDNFTVPLAIFTFVGTYTTEWNLLFAAMIIGCLPILIAFVLLQRFVLRGLTGGLKG